MEYFFSSNRWSRNDSDIDPEKSSIGEISSKISSRPDLSGTSPRPAALASATRACQRSLPSSQSKLSVCRARRSGTSRGSRIFAKEIRPDAVIAVDTVWVAVREAAKDGPSTGFLKLKVQRHRANTFSARRHRSDKAVGAVPEGSTEATRRNMRQRKATAYL